jgi:hypothetical protein
VFFSFVGGNVFLDFRILIVFANGGRGSSPLTVSVYDLRDNKRVVEVSISRDVRNAIHGPEVWRH